MTYGVLFQVALGHDYFADGRLRELALEPTPATVERLRRVGWLLKPLPNGFAVLGTGAALPSAAAQSTVFPLLFSLIPTNPLFFNYTSIDPQPGLTPIYRLGPAPRKPGVGQVVAGTGLALRPVVFAHPVAAASAARTARLLSLVSGRLLDSPLVPARAPNVALDLSHWGSGAYQLQLGADSLAFYADDYLYATQPWALLEVGASVLQAKPNTIYTLRFAARATYWQYQLLAQNPPVPAGLQIKTGTAITFAPEPGAVGEAPLWRASQAVPLAEHYPMLPYQLLGLHSGQNIRGKGQIVLPALPQAIPSSFRTEQTAQGKIFISDISVYL